MLDFGAVTTEIPAKRGSSSPTLATLLSFLWPGLGQLYLGARRRALIFGLPLLVVVAVVAIQALGGPERLLIELLTPSTALTVLILIVLLGLLRIVSMGDALLTASPGGSWRRPVPVASFLLMAAIVVSTHLAAGSLAFSFYEAGRDIFVGETDPDGALPPPVVVAHGSAMPGSAIPSSAGTPLPSPNPAARINIMLTGIDSSEIRSHALTDTIIVVSVDPTTGSTAMISLPRDLSRLKKPGGGTYMGKINSLMSYADRHPEEYPEGGMAALTEQVGYLLGTRIDYYASVDLEGFSKLIDRVGGVTIDVPKALDDPSYGGWTKPGKLGFKVSTGRHTFDGETALAYVRTRKSVGDSDFGRARRQQQLLVALQKKLVDPAMLPNLPGILKDATKTLKTNFPPASLSDMLDIARKTDDAAVKRVVLGPPYSRHPTKITSVYILVPDMERIAQLSIDLFGAESRYAKNPG